MTTLNIGYFKEKLLKMRAELEEVGRISAESRKPVELDQTMVGRLSRMDAMQQQEMALANERRRNRSGAGTD